MLAYKLATPAKLDVVEIVDYLLENAGGRVALRIEARLRSTFRLIAKFPSLGHPRTDITSLPVLFITAGSYVIIYHQESDGILILAILHGSRDINSALQERPI